MSAILDTLSLLPAFKVKRDSVSFQASTWTAVVPYNKYRVGLYLSTDQEARAWISDAIGSSRGIPFGKETFTDSPIGIVEVNASNWPAVVNEQWFVTGINSGGTVEVIEVEFDASKLRDYL